MTSPNLVMVIRIGLCNNYCCPLTQFKQCCPSKTISSYLAHRILFSSSTDAYLDNLLLEEGIKRESIMSKYFENATTKNSFKETLRKVSAVNNNYSDLQQQNNSKDLMFCIEKEIDTNVVPNKKLNYFLIYFVKDGNLNGVKAIQNIVKKYNLRHYNLQSEYNHYLAEALWINGKIQISLQLFSVAYDNKVIKPKVKVMLASLFPLLVAQHSEATLNRTICSIEQFSAEKQDDIILAYLWKDLFQSTWFSDQQQANQLLKKNKNLLSIIQWLIPAMGKDLLRDHRIDDFYRLIYFTLENGFKSMGVVLIRLQFDYYYIHQNIERCTAVVKYSSNLNCPLTDEQQRRYVSLLLKSKDVTLSKKNIKKPQNLKYSF